MSKAVGEWRGTEYLYRFMMDVLLWNGIWPIDPGGITHLFCLFCVYMKGDLPSKMFEVCGGQTALVFTTFRR